MPPNEGLAVALARVRSTGRPAWRIAEEAGISETRLSRLKVGRAQPKPAEVAALAKTLGEDATTLFPDQEKGSADG